MFKSQQTNRPKSLGGNANQRNAESSSLPNPYGDPFCPDLALIVNAWPDLPDPIKAAVLALVWAASPSSSVR
jgi:hypothetical protein